MTVPTAVRAAAALELKQRQTEGQRVGVLVRAHDGKGWRWKGGIITDDEAALVRRSFRGQMIVVERIPGQLPTWSNP